MGSATLRPTPLPGRPAAYDARLCPLPPGVRVSDVADASRSAALGFAWSAHQGWGRRELAWWLSNPYARATAATCVPRQAEVRLTYGRPPLEELHIQDLMTRARTEVIDVLRGVWAWTHDAAAARARINEGLVAGIVDEASHFGYAAVDHPRMSLAERVRSLFIADYLTRPADYAAFAICPDCDGATFDGGLYHTGCTRPRARTVLRHRAARDVMLPCATPASGAPASAARRVG